MKKEPVINVFVYGTLQTGESNHRVVNSHIINVKPGRILGRLYNTGHFPAVVLDKQGYEIEGEWLTIRHTGLKETDRLEGYRGSGERNFYDRVMVTDIYSKVSGWVYVWKEPKGLPELVNGSWKNRLVPLS